jgi:hypothetical protein
MQHEFPIFNLRVNCKALINWRHTSPTTEKFKAQPSEGNVMLPLFWDSEGPTLERNQAEGETVNSEGYRVFLTKELKPATGTKRTGRLSQTVIFTA